MDAIPLSADFADFLRLLNDHRVRYLLIGGYAVGLHGYVRGTQDIDVWIAMTPENAARVVVVLEAFGFTPLVDTQERLQKASTIIRLGHPPYRIEISTSIDGVEFAGCYERRVVMDLQGLEVPVISRDDLKANKLAAGRWKDLNDLEHLP